MVWHNNHRAGRRKRERIAALQKRPIITAIETGQFLSDNAKQKLQRAAWRARHANFSEKQDVETIDLTQEPEETTNSTDTAEQIEFPAVYTATVTRLFTKIEKQLLIIRYKKRNQINN